MNALQIVTPSCKYGDEILWTSCVCIVAPLFLDRRSEMAAKIVKGELTLLLQSAR